MALDPGNSSIRAVFFDLAGTLITVRGGIGAQYSAMAREYGVEADAAAIDGAFFNAFRSTGRMVFEQPDPDEVASADLRRNTGPQIHADSRTKSGPQVHADSRRMVRVTPEVAALEKRFWKKVVRLVFAATGALAQFPPGQFDRYFDRLFDYFATATGCGPVQLTFSRSIDPVVSLEHSITRIAVATREEAESQGGENRTMGRKTTIPYGLYRCHGFVSAHLAAQTGFSVEDLELVWRGLCQMFEDDRSAARGLMSSRKLYVFEHQSALGNAPAHALFERLVVRRKDSEKPARSFQDYEVLVDRENLPEGIDLIEKL